ncbi:unnamed protein product [Cylicocyclus nassatus]|uniref:Uncharacterized protein n=1 Tax=Cylicocyclus nassatus TaxID=53992 RepID=A0AA36GV75_CYLNA|nr:unnamed protein product [Cylicocyclus nassatus]
MSWEVSCCPQRFFVFPLLLHCSEESVSSESFETSVNELIRRGYVRKFEQRVQIQMNSVYLPDHGPSFARTLLSGGC